MNMHRFPMGSGSGAPPSCFPLLCFFWLWRRGARMGLTIKNSQPVRSARTTTRSPTLAQQVSDLHPVVQHTGWKR